MYEEDFIFGPLTFKQFTYVTVGGSVAVLAVNFIEGVLPLGIATLALTVGAKLAYDHRPKKIELSNLPVFLAEKKITLGEQKYKQWLKTMIAAKASYLKLRQERGLDSDIELEGAIKILKQAFTEEVAPQS